MFCSALEKICAALSVLIAAGCAAPVRKINVTPLHADDSSDDLDSYERLTDKERGAFTPVAFDEALKLFDESGTGMVVYSADWCPYCQRALPVLADAALEAGAQYAAFFDHQCDGETDAVTARLNDMIAEYELAHGDECDPVFEFLFASDADGILDCAGCDALKKLISADPQKHSELESLRIGYEGWAHPATGADFMRLLDESAEAQTALTWY